MYASLESKQIQQCPQLKEYVGVPAMDHLGWKGITSMDAS